ncbi:putative Universal stress protein A-like protein [Cocos nucifera]|uniref:Putative Universal stress protein A-like protein n=1 Tax=Cocos nucifera TaxID=13894 RepID=A0A8K0I7M6_COCNU|nr:putative Universal stress protein A-like protein [Cocos nucifera]
MADVAAMEERRMVVAVDESEESTYALQWCLRNLIHPAGEGATARNTLILLYARPPPPAYSPLDGTGYLFSDEVTASIDKYSKDLAVSVMERARNVCKNYSNIKVEEKVRVGDARDVICEMVRKLGADLLVVGSHGYGFIKRAFLGSVSDHCARNAKCPCAVIGISLVHALPRKFYQQLKRLQRTLENPVRWCRSLELTCWLWEVMAMVSLRGLFWGVSVITVLEMPSVRF